MWDTLNDNDKQKINDIVNHFALIFEDISLDTLRDRVFCGYCWGEGGFRITSIKDWNEVFNYTKIGQMLFTRFESWEDYIKHNGDWHKKKQE